MTFYTLNMAVEQVEAILWARKKMQILIFCEIFQSFCFFWLHSKNLHFASASVNFGYWLGSNFFENFQIFKKIKIFNFSPAHSYVLRPCWEYEKSFLDFKEAKKNKKQCKIINITSLKSQKWLKFALFLSFFYFFFPSQ